MSDESDNSQRDEYYDRLEETGDQGPDLDKSHCPYCRGTGQTYEPGIGYHVCQDC